jgi:hypothetical protein
MTLVRYAGFDPHENEFDDGALAPPPSRARRARHYRTTLDTDRIRQLRELGMTWCAIGRQLAAERGRPVPYLGASVWWAARYATPRVTS